MSSTTQLHERKVFTSVANCHSDIIRSVDPEASGAVVLGTKDQNKAYQRRDEWRPEFTPIYLVFTLLREFELLQCDARPNEVTIRAPYFGALNRPNAGRRYKLQYRYEIFLEI